MTEIDGNPAKKMKFSKLTVESLKEKTHDELVQRVLELQNEVEALHARQTKDQGLDVLHETVEKLKQQVTESARQESLLLQRLAAKDHELQQVQAQHRALKVARNASAAQLQNMMLDPAVNLMFIHMTQEMEMSKTKLEQAQSEMAAWKFTPDSQTGKRLMAKCRMLLQENEELGKTVSTGKIAKLEGDIALKQKLIMEMKKSETETEEFLAEMDEDMESMQSTVYLLQQELKDAREKLRRYEYTSDADPDTKGGSTVQPVCNGSSNKLIKAERNNEMRTDDDSDAINSVSLVSKSGVRTFDRDLNGDDDDENQSINQSIHESMETDAGSSNLISGRVCRTTDAVDGGLKITLRTSLAAAKNNNKNNDESAELSVDPKYRTKNDSAHRTPVNCSTLSTAAALTNSTDSISNGFVKLPMTDRTSDSDGMGD